MTTSAVNEKRRPPLTTLATRLISTTRSLSSRVSSRWKAMALLEGQAALARGVGERLHAPVVEVAAAIEDDVLDAGLLRGCGEALAHLGGLLGLVALEGLRQVEPARGGECAA